MIKLKTCIRCGKEFIPTGRNQKYCKECGIIARKKQKKEIKKQWYKIHSEEAKEKSKKYRKAYPEIKKQWNKMHPEKVKESTQKWQKTHPEKMRAYARKSARKRNHKRRNLGFIPLNEAFTGSEAHHINKKYIVFIPKSLHRSVNHNQFTGQGIKEINKLVFNWLAEQGINYEYLIFKKKFNNFLKFFQKTIAIFKKPV